MPDPNFILLYVDSPAASARLLCRPARQAAGRILRDLRDVRARQRRDARPVVAPHRRAGGNRVARRRRACLRARRQRRRRPDIRRLAQARTADRAGADRPRFRTYLRGARSRRASAAASSTSGARHEPALDRGRVRRARAAWARARHHAGLSRQGRAAAASQGRRRRRLLLADRLARRQGQAAVVHTIGRVTDDRTYQADMGAGFRPFRRDVCYAAAQDAPIAPLLDRLEFTRGKRTGVTLSGSGWSKSARRISP